MVDETPPAASNCMGDSSYDTTPVETGLREVKDCCEKQNEQLQGYIESTLSAITSTLSVLQSSLNTSILAALVAPQQIAFQLAEAIDESLVLNFANIYSQTLASNPGLAENLIQSLTTVPPAGQTVVSVQPTQPVEINLGGINVNVSQQTPAITVNATSQSNASAEANARGGDSQPVIIQGGDTRYPAGFPDVADRPADRRDGNFDRGSGGGFNSRNNPQAGGNASENIGGRNQRGIQKEGITCPSLIPGSYPVQIVGNSDKDPVDLDQPNAWMFSGEDSEWKARMLAFWEGKLDLFNSGMTLGEIIAYRKLSVPVEPEMVQ